MVVQYLVKSRSLFLFYRDLGSYNLQIGQDVYYEKVKK